MKKLPNKKQDNGWVKCTPGAIQMIADSGQLTHGRIPAANLQRRKLLVGAATAAGVAVLGGAAYLAAVKPRQRGNAVSEAAQPMSNLNVGGISCVEVIQLAPAYVDKTIQDQEKLERIEKHLQLCEKCRMTYQQQSEI